MAMKFKKKMEKKSLSQSVKKKETKKIAERHLKACFQIIVLIMIALTCL